MRLYLIVTSTALLTSSPSLAGDFAFEVDSPGVRVVIPNVPPIKMGPHPLSQNQSHLRLLGSEGPFTVSLLMPTADAGMTPAECAGSTIGALPKRPGVPAQSQIYKARINERTYIALYRSQFAGEVQLHAHLVSAVGGTHCVEVHISKSPASDEDAKAWNKNWGTANIEAKQ